MVRKLMVNLTFKGHDGSRQRNHDGSSSRKQMEKIIKWLVEKR
jgi:hypothetical protein